MNPANLVHRSLVTSVALGAVLLSGIALAADPAADSTSAAQSMTVRYDDVNLSTVTGATVLYHRIQGAARLVCGDSGRNLSEQQAWRQCDENAVAEAVATVNNPTLTAVYQGREGQMTAMLRK